jgi:hypothetical protein
MSDCKTVTHEGKVYQIGGVYEFSDDGVDWAMGILLVVGASPIFPFEARKYPWKLIREVNYTIGTITTAPPIELIDGEVYMFGYGNRLNAVGVYDKWEKRFYHLRGMYFGFEDCTNIRLMTVEKK